MYDLQYSLVLQQASAIADNLHGLSDPIDKCKRLNYYKSKEKIQNRGPSAQNPKMQAAEPEEGHKKYEFLI